MTDLDLDAIEARANAATDGPWGYPFAGKNRITTPVDIDITEADWGGENLREYVLSCLDDRNAWRAADAEFIAHARTDIPALVAALREARAEVDHLTDLLADVNDSAGQWRRRYDALRDGVTGLHFRDARGGCASCIDPDGFSVRWPCETAAVVARVEGDES